MMTMTVVVSMTWGEDAAADDRFVLLRGGLRITSWSTGPHGPSQRPCLTEGWG